MLSVMAQPQLEQPVITPPTLSVPILPSAPMPYSRPTLHPSPAKRPKLSLNTSESATVFGKKSTSLRWDTLSATSPTSINTFGNGYHQQQQLSPPRSPRSPTARRGRPKLRPLTTVIPTPQPTQRPSSSQSSDSQDSEESTSSSATSVSTIESLSGRIPYKLSYTVQSILTNGPYGRTSRITKPYQRKMFPAAKRVSFRAPLTEEVVTTKYTMAHSDIQSSVSTISTLDLSVVEGSTVSNSEDSDSSEPINAPSHDEGEQDTCPETPVAGRRKRERQWRWTLGRTESDDDHQQDEADADHSSSDEKSSTEQTR